MKSTRRLFSIFFMLCVAHFAAQEKLALQDAIGNALKNNFDVRIGRNNTEIAKAQNNPGNAGMSPTISLNANLAGSMLNSYQEFNNGTVQDRPAANANSSQVSVNADWMIFDGGRMFAVRKRLEAGEAFSRTVLKQQMENTVFSVINAYYDCVRIRSLLKAGQQNLQLAAERARIAAVRLEIGSDSKVDMLITRTEENRARTSNMQLELQLMDAQTRLNQLMGRSTETEFTTADTMVAAPELSIDDLRKKAGTSSSSMILARQQQDILSLGVKEAGSSRLPFIQVGGAYLLNRSQSQAGFVLSNRQSGFNFGVSARWIIFNGGRNSKLIAERKLLYQNAELELAAAQMLVEGAVLLQFRSLQLSRQMAELERRNLEDSREVLTIALERYRIGKSALLETIETQKILEDAQLRFINALYAMKVAEAELLRLNGSLVN